MLADAIGEGRPVCSPSVRMRCGRAIPRIAPRWWIAQDRRRRCWRLRCAQAAAPASDAECRRSGGRRTSRNEAAISGSGASQIDRRSGGRAKAIPAGKIHRAGIPIARTKAARRRRSVCGRRRAAGGCGRADGGGFARAGAFVQPSRSKAPRACATPTSKGGADAGFEEAALRIGLNRPRRLHERRRAFSVAEAVAGWSRRARQGKMKQPRAGKVNWFLAFW